VIRAILSPPVMIAMLLVVAILTIAGTFSLLRLRGPIPAVVAARRALRTARVEGYVIRVSTVLLVLAAIIVVLFLL
jgi:hypothetical protein